MNDWNKVKDIFGRVVELPTAERAEFLLAECGADAELRAEVKSLLAANDDDEHDLDKAGLDLHRVFANEKTANLMNRRFGNYRVIREIARGGMGAVFLAERDDGEFQQQVALKIIRQSLPDSRLESSFRRERQILAQLVHPNIARLLDGGVAADGELFFVMEYIAGENLLDYAARRNLNLDERLRLFRQICGGVSFAHQNLIVHRDLKPSNILITDDGTPKLLDFGIAKIIETNDDNVAESLQTVTQFRALTPEYAAPEQLRGQRVTTSADVYSLGVILYELLTDARPFHFKSNDWNEILRVVNDTDPPRPSEAVTQINSIHVTNANKIPQSAIRNPHSLRGDLDNIILKAMRKEPENRYASVAALSEDIRRHLENLPVAARPISRLMRAAKFVKRHQIPVAAAVFIALSLIAGTSAAVWQANAARQQQLRAEKRFNDVRQLSNALLNDIAPKIERLAGATEARQAITAQSLKYLDSLAAESGDDADLHSELATAYEKIGDLQGNPANPNINELTAAVTSYEKANKIRRRLLEKQPSNIEQKTLLANNYRALGDIYWQTNDHEKSLTNAGQALNLFDELLTRDANNQNLRFGRAQSLYGIGHSLSSNQKYHESLDYFAQVIEIADKLPQDVLAIKKLRADAHQQFAYALSWDNQQQSAEAETTRAVALSEALTAAAPNDVGTQIGLWQTYTLASSVYEDQNNQLAKDFAFKALHVIEPIAAADSANLRAKQQLAKTYSRVGATLINLNSHDEAAPYLEKAVSNLREIAASSNRYQSNLALALTRLGDARRKQKNFAAALENLTEAAQIQTQVIEQNQDDHNTQKNLASTYQSLGQTRELLQSKLAARQDYSRALEILRRLQSENALAKSDEKFLAEMQIAAR